MNNVGPGDGDGGGISFMAVGVLGGAVVVATAGYFIISKFSASISAMQGTAEQRWQREEASVVAKIAAEKDTAAGASSSV